MLHPIHTVHSADPSAKGIMGPTRRHIISRLNKASRYAERLVSVLQDQSLSGASDIDLLEARAYLALLSGGLHMEKQKWDQCLQQFSLARIIYSALSQKERKEAYREIISVTIDPSLRYAAYQLKISRNKPLPSLAIERFPGDNNVRAELEKVDPNCLIEDAAGTTRLADGEIEKLPETITWRSRSVPIEDASIAQALAAATAAESKLSAFLQERPSASPREKAAAYDNVILASQEIVDATKTAIDDLTNEGVDRGDRRIQALQVTRTAVNYSLVSWRVGRNRVLSGEHDGLLLDGEQTKTDERRKTVRQESGGKILSQLREKVALYDSVLQSLDFVQELPGVAGDTDFVDELEAKRNYFRALRCFAIGRSHSFQENTKNALALFSRSSELATTIQKSGKGITANSGPPRLDVSAEEMDFLATTSQGFEAKYRGLVSLDKLSETKQDPARLQLPLIERMDEYAVESLNLTNLVPFPPKMRAIPVKPLFLDVAWNYIQYPRERTEEQEEAPNTEGRRGWFGFRR
ncbi:signal recognition particle, putative [Talaromyces marneffei ATCC 18224]|uniref:Signal recognition particle subunit SRP68 n=1 Tax=Talaromyces marneffei (strain ATCC 18224 / CBS 334.59 / QM 7333) TaxID=441960 RepID=B6QKS3_TALMQ|nr:signal recognition particle, putative [Talaromyces marneffei ATCC 18224]